MKHLFICGAGRSGTTLLWRILNNSPFVNLAPEIQYFSSLYHNGFLHNYKKLKRRADRATLDHFSQCLKMNNHFGRYWERRQSFTEKEITSFFNTRTLNEKNIYQFLMVHDLLRTGKNRENLKYIGEKTPLNIFHVRRLIKWFPEAKVLFIYRNPIEVLRSEVNKKKKDDYFLAKNNFLYPYGLAVFVFFEWLLATVIALYHANKNKDNFIGVSFEKLTNQQKATVQEICATLDIGFDEVMCVFRKVASSYSDGEKQTYWYPPKWVVFLYTLCFCPLQNLLNKRFV